MSTLNPSSQSLNLESIRSEQNKISIYNMAISECNKLGFIVEIWLGSNENRDGSLPAHVPGPTATIMTRGGGIRIGPPVIMHEILAVTRSNALKVTGYKFLIVIMDCKFKLE